MLTQASPTFFCIRYKNQGRRKVWKSGVPVVMWEHNLPAGQDRVNWKDKKPWKYNKFYLFVGSNKYIKKGQYKSRQTSRKNRSEDVFHWDVDRSDPVILSYAEDDFLRKKARSKHEIPPEVLALMRDPTPEDLEEELDSDEEGLLDDVLNNAWKWNQ